MINRSYELLLVKVDGQHIGKEENCFVNATIHYAKRGQMQLSKYCFEMRKEKYFLHTVYKLLLEELGKVCIVNSLISFIYKDNL